MSDGPQCRFFQIHLSTAVVLMIVTGCLLALNMRSLWPEDPRTSVVAWLPDEQRADPLNREYGWPLKAQEYVPHYSEGGDGWRLSFSWRAVLVDLAFAASILAGMLVLCEFQIHRHEARIP